jgi:hypothetical protein
MQQPEQTEQEWRDSLQKGDKVLVTSSHPSFAAFVARIDYAGKRDLRVMYYGNGVKFSRSTGRKQGDTGMFSVYIRSLEPGEEERIKNRERWNYLAYRIQKYNPAGQPLEKLEAIAAVMFADDCKNDG